MQCLFFHVSLKKICFFLIFAEVLVSCKINQSLMKNFTCVSPPDNTILIVSTTDLGNVYAMSLMVQKDSSYNGLHGMALKTVRTSFLKFK